MACKHRNRPVCSLLAGLTGVLKATPCLLCGCWDLNSGLRAWIGMQELLTADPCVQAQVFVYIEMFISSRFPCGVSLVPQSSSVDMSSPTRSF